MILLFDGRIKSTKSCWQFGIVHDYNKTAGVPLQIKSEDGDVIELENSLSINNLLHFALN